MFPWLKTLGLAAATREEAKAIAAACDALSSDQANRVAYDRIYGMGRAGAEHLLKSYQEFSNLKLIVSTGYCGGLRLGLEPGALVLAECVLDAEEKDANADFETLPALRGLVLDALQAAGLSAHTGKVVTTAQAIFESEAKQALGRKLEAIALDMESSHLAAGAKSRDCAFLCLRAVSDGAGEDLPPQVAGFIDDRGEVRLGQVTKFALGGPRNIGALNRLRKNAAGASAALTGAWKVLLPKLLEWCGEPEPAP
ncbi:MAG: hypothetical protein L6R28_03630 [Planctomycetes bacterium]|nr:hypothetical protein [Planctomycetota bacterium]